MKKHPEYALELLSRIDYLHPALEIPYSHHEKWDGSGYPRGLVGEQIPLAARILRVSDAYAALTDARPYRPALTETDARRHLTEWAGLEFDPRVVRAFLSLHNLPALRSYAPRAEDAAAAGTTPGAEAAGEAPTGLADEGNVGGQVPLRGVNTYAGQAAQSAPGASPDAVQTSDSNRDFAGDTAAARFTKADTDRHA